MVAHFLHVIDHSLTIIGEGQPIDLRPLRGTGPLPDIAPAVFVDHRLLETLGEQVTHDLVVEEHHAAVGVVNDEKFLRSEQLVGDDQRPDRVLARPATRIADDMRVALGQTGELRGIHPRVHAGQHGEAAGRRQRQFAFVTESGDVRGVGFFDALDNGGFAHKTLEATRLPCL